MPLQISELVEKRITKKGKEWCVVSEDGSRNLGCGPSEEWATNRLRQVEFFKHQHKSLSEEGIIAALEDGSIGLPSDTELKSFLEETAPAAIKHNPGRHDQKKHAGAVSQAPSQAVTKPSAPSDDIDELTAALEKPAKAVKLIGTAVSMSTVLTKAPFELAASFDRSRKLLSIARNSLAGLSNAVKLLKAGSDIATVVSTVFKVAKVVAPAAAAIGATAAAVSAYKNAKDRGSDLTKYYPEAKGASPREYPKPFKDDSPGVSKEASEPFPAADYKDTSAEPKKAPKFYKSSAKDKVPDTADIDKAVSSVIFPMLKDAEAIDKEFMSYERILDVLEKRGKIDKSKAAPVKSSIAKYRKNLASLKSAAKGFEEEEDTVQKHLAGRHDQKRHAGSEYADTSDFETSQERRGKGHPAEDIEKLSDISNLGSIEQEYIGPITVYRQGVPVQGMVDTATGKFVELKVTGEQGVSAPRGRPLGSRSTYNLVPERDEKGRPRKLVIAIHKAAKKAKFFENLVTDIGKISTAFAGAIAVAGVIAKNWDAIYQTAKSVKGAIDNLADRTRFNSMERGQAYEKDLQAYEQLEGIRDYTGLQRNVRTAEGVEEFETWYESQFPKERKKKDETPTSTTKSVPGSDKYYADLAAKTAVKAESKKKKAVAGLHSLRSTIVAQEREARLTGNIEVADALLATAASINRLFSEIGNYEESFVEKHLAGRHDQKRHAPLVYTREGAINAAVPKEPALAKFKRQSAQAADRARNFVKKNRNAIVTGTVVVGGAAVAGLAAAYLSKDPRTRQSIDKLAEFLEKKSAAIKPDLEDIGNVLREDSGRRSTADRIRNIKNSAISAAKVLTGALERKDPSSPHSLTLSESKPSADTLQRMLYDVTSALPYDTDEQPGRYKPMGRTLTEIIQRSSSFSDAARISKARFDAWKKIMTDDNGLPKAWRDALSSIKDKDIDDIAGGLRRDWLSSRKVQSGLDPSVLANDSTYSAIDKDPSTRGLFYEQIGFSDLFDYIREQEGKKKKK